jgi:hypothetical protein
MQKIGEGFSNIQNIISSLFNPTKALVDTFKEMGPVASFIATALGAAGIAVTAVLLPGLIKSAGAALAALGPMIATAYAAMTTAISTTLGAGAIPIIAGIALAAGAIAAVTSIKDGMISPDGGLVVSGEKGTYKLDKNDSIIAGTELGRTVGGGQTTMPVMDLSPLVAEMQNVRAVLQQILAKEGSVYIDSTKAGTAFAIGTSKLQ